MALKPTPYSNGNIVEKHINTAFDTVLSVADSIEDGSLQIASDAPVLTAADVASTNADVVTTNQDTIDTAADLVATNQDTIDTAADLVATNQDTLDTAADLVLTNADVVLTGADVALTNADVVSTNADVVTTNQDTIDTAADLVATGEDVTYAEEWATKAEDSLISVAAGGDGVSDYSALHWSNKAAASGGLAGTATGTVDVVTATLGMGSLSDQDLVMLRMSGTNTVTVPTFNPDGLGAKSIVKDGNTALAVGDIPIEAILKYNLANTTWELLNPDPDNVVARAFAGESGAPLLVNAAITDATITGVKLNAITVGDYEIASGFYNGLAAGLQKKLEFTLPQGGTYRTVIALIHDAKSGSSSARIYKNGSTFGTQRITSGDATYTEDLTFAAGDLIQVYIQNSGDNFGSVNLSLRSAAGDAMHPQPIGTL